MSTKKKRLNTSCPNRETIECQLFFDFPLISALFMLLVTGPIPVIVTSLDLGPYGSQLLARTHLVSISQVGCDQAAPIDLTLSNPTHQLNYAGISQISPPICCTLIFFQSYKYTDRFYHNSICSLFFKQMQGCICRAIHESDFLYAASHHS